MIRVEPSYTAKVFAKDGDMMRGKGMMRGKDIGGKHTILDIPKLSL